MRSSPVCCCGDGRSRPVPWWRPELRPVRRGNHREPGAAASGGLRRLREAILAALGAAYSREEPILIYLWTPHSALNKYDLTEVKLPDYTDACAATAPEGVDCDYPADELFKIMSGDLSETAPEAASFLTKMSYQTSDQVEMLALVETDGMSVDEAAAKWIESHPDTWKAWLS
ncbi:MAG: glycine betaine ABC transporter substrate-binding protein [Acidimicrobiales bacterium]